MPLMAVHPAEHIKDELRERGMTQRELAAQLGMKPSNLCRMLKDRETVTPSMAVKLEAALGIPADFWLRCQVGYERDTAAIAERDKRELAAAGEEKALAAVFNLPELYARLKVNPYAFAQEKLRRLAEIFGAPPSLLPETLPARSGRYKRSGALDTDERNLRTWEALAYVSARNNPPRAPYAPGNAKAAAEEIAAAAHRGGISDAEIKEILGRRGVSYSVVGKLGKTPVDAYSAWVGEYPAVVVTHRRDDADTLVFDTLHELGHIALHLRPGGGAFVSAGDNADNAKEREADKFAEDALIPRGTWARIMKTSARSLSCGDIVKILTAKAAEERLNPRLVLWRYRFETRRFALRGVKTARIERPLQENIV